MKVVVANKRGKYKTISQNLINNYLIDLSIILFLLHFLFLKLKIGCYLISQYIFSFNFAFYLL